MWWHRRGPSDDEFRQEIEAHVALETERLVGEGLSQEEAARAAKRRFGNPTTAQEEYRESRPFGWLNDFGRDFRYALRTLRRAPAFAAVAIATLALGIGANAAIFSVIDAVLIRPLPYEDADHLLVASGRRRTAFTEPRASFFEPWPELTESPLLESSAAAIPGGLNLGGEGAERVRAAAVTSGFFRTIGVDSLAGRPFGPADLVASRQVAVIGERLWRQRFAADPAVVGRVINLNGQPFTVMGVLPSQVQFPGVPDVWIPTGSDQQIEDGNVEPVVVVRMRDGILPAVVREALAHSTAQREDPDERDYYVTAVRVTPLADTLRGDVQPVLVLVGASAALVLLVSTFNVASLLLIRGAARDREFAVRLTLGASRWRIGCLVLVESGVLSGVAACVAIPMSMLLVAGVSGLLPAGQHGAADVGPDAQVFVAVAVLSLVTAVLAGLVPALSIRRQAWSRVACGTATPDRTRARLRGAFVVAQIAVALVLLAGAATVVQKVADVMAADLGVRGENVVTLRLSPPPATYPDSGAVHMYFDRVEAALRGVPGVRSVGTTPHLPGGETGIVSAAGAVIEGVKPLRDGFPTALALSASPGYFTAIGIDLLAGRTFIAADVAPAPKVALVGLAVVEAYGLTPRDVIGRRLQLTSSSREEFEIVGVVRDVLMFGAENNDVSAYYVPFAQLPALGSERYVAGQTAFLVVQGEVEPLHLVPALREAVARIDPNVPVYDVRSFDDVRATYLTERRFVMTLMLTFGALAIVLAALGLYAVIGHAVERRTRELGIRIALGASASQVRGATLRGGAGLAAVGVVLGSVLAFGLWRIVAARVENVGELQMTSVAVIAAGIVAVALGATWLPARRAAQVDPVAALRAE